MTAPWLLPRARSTSARGSALQETTAINIAAVPAGRVRARMAGRS